MSIDPFADFYVEDEETVDDQSIKTPTASIESENIDVTESNQQDPFTNFYVSDEDESITTKPKQEKTLLSEKIKGGIEKGARISGQAALGTIQRFTFPYDLAAIFAKKTGELAAPQRFREHLFSQIEDLLDKKVSGNFKSEDQERYDYLVDLIKNPEKTKQFTQIETPSFDVGSLIEKAADTFGVDISPQGADEMAARWYGFIKNPSKVKDLFQNPNNLTKLQSIAKSILPTSKEAVRSASAGTLLQYAADNEFGPMGTMAMALIGDLGPSIVGGGAEGIKKLSELRPSDVTEGLKKGSAALISKLTSESKKAIQSDLIKSFRESGIQADLGSVTGSKLIKWVQTTLKNSHLGGEDLEKFQKSLTKNIVKEYENIAEQLGEVSYRSNFEAGQAMKEGIAGAKKTEKAIHRELYSDAMDAAGEQEIYAGNVASQINELEQKLIPGSLKSSDQQQVLNVLAKIKKDVTAPDGTIKASSVKDLVNNKIALNDVINYEVEGGAKELLKNITKEIDKALEGFGAEKNEFGELFKTANKKFSEYAKLYRGKTLGDVNALQDPTKVFAKMSTPHGVREVEKALGKTTEGRELFGKLARHKLEEVIGNNLVDSTTQQANLGTFSKLLEKGQNRDLVRSLVGESSLQKLQKLQYASGRLAESAQKFFNASKSGYQASNMAITAGLIYDFTQLLAGNPWPAVRSLGIWSSSKQMAKLISDPEYIKLIEEAMMTSERGTSSSMSSIADKLVNKSKELLKSTKEQYPSLQ
jgi:hypothetical protein